MVLLSSRGPEPRVRGHLRLRTRAGLSQFMCAIFFTMYEYFYNESHLAWCRAADTSYGGASPGWAGARARACSCTREPANIFG